MYRMIHMNMYHQTKNLKQKTKKKPTTKKTKKKSSTVVKRFLVSILQIIFKQTRLTNDHQCITLCRCI